MECEGDYYIIKKKPQGSGAVFEGRGGYHDATVSSVVTIEGVLVSTACLIFEGGHVLLEQVTPALAYSCGGQTDHSKGA